MRILVLYATKYGATEQIAKLLAEELGTNTDLWNIKKDGKPDLTLYDTVILGGSIYMGRIQRAIRSFGAKQKKILLQKRLGLFISCATPPETSGYLERFFSEELCAHAVAEEILGGLFQYEKMSSFFQKIIRSMMAEEGFRQKFGEPKLSTEKISDFAQKIRTEKKEILSE